MVNGLYMHCTLFPCKWPPLAPLVTVIRKFYYNLSRYFMVVPAYQKCHEMKKLILFTVLLFILMAGYSQVPDGVHPLYKTHHFIDEGYADSCIGHLTIIHKDAYDTIPVTMLVSDTSHYYYSYWQESTYTEDSIMIYGKHISTRHYDSICEDRGQQNFMVFRMNGYSVRERHNTSEGEMDPGGMECFDEHGHLIDCFHDYWLHVRYLDSNKKPLKSTIIVWQSLNRK